jgi:hypothetical protein
MSLVNRPLRGQPTALDDTIERYLAQLAAGIEPDPVFRRRLRSYAVNGFVAVREGISPERTRKPRRQTGRVPRAFLYASFALGVSAASVLAASQESLPGEVFDALRQRIEELRWNLAPAQLQGELAIGHRADIGAPDLATAVAPSINDEYERAVGPGLTMEAAAAARIQRHLLVIEGLDDRLRARAHAAVDHLIDPQGIGQGSEHLPRSGSGAGASLGRGHATAPGADPRPAIGPQVDRSLTIPSIQKPQATANREPTGPMLGPSIAPALSDRPHQLDRPIAPPAHDHPQQTEQASLPGGPAKPHDAGPPDHAENQKTE